MVVYRTYERHRQHPRQILKIMVKTQRPIKFIIYCGAIVDINLLEQAILWYANAPTTSIKHIFKHGRYAAVSIFKEKIHIHRLIGLFIAKSKKCADHFHHKNGDKMDNRVDNIERINPSIHISKHQKGRKICASQRAGILRFNHSRKGTRTKPHRPEVTPQMVFDLHSQGLSFNQISLKLNIDWGCVKKRYEDFIHDNPELLNSKQ